MISLKVGGIIVAAFIAGAFVASPELRAYAANTVFSTDIVDGEVKTPDLAAGAVTNAKIASSAVTNSKIGSGSVTNSKIGPNAVTTSKIADGTIGYADVSRAFIVQEHREDCNCGGTGWDPDGSRKSGIIADSRITYNSVIIVSGTGVSSAGFVCWVDGVSTGFAGVSCNSNILNGEAINYAIIRNPAYG